MGRRGLYNGNFIPIWIFPLFELVKKLLGSDLSFFFDLIIVGFDAATSARDYINFFS